MTMELGGTTAPLANEGTARDNGVLADHGAVHDGRVDTDEAVVADRAAMNGAVMGDGAVIANNGRRCSAHMNHREVLDVGVARRS